LSFFAAIKPKKFWKLKTMKIDVFGVFCFLGFFGTMVAKKLNEFEFYESFPIF